MSSLCRFDQCRHGPHSGSYRLCMDCPELYENKKEKKTILNSTKIETTFGDITAAHKEACSDARRILEKLYPVLKALKPVEREVTKEIAWRVCDGYVRYLYGYLYNVPIVIVSSVNGIKVRSYDGKVGALGLFRVVPSHDTFRVYYTPKEAE